VISEPQKVTEEVKEAPREEEFIKKENLIYELISKYGWENEGNLVK